MNADQGIAGTATRARVGSDGEEGGGGRRRRKSDGFIHDVRGE